MKCHMFFVSVRLAAIFQLVHAYEYNQRRASCVVRHGVLKTHGKTRYNNTQKVEQNRKNKSIQ